MNVLIVSPGSEIVRMLSVLLAPDGLSVESCTTAAESEGLPPGYRIAVLIVDAVLPDGEGIDVVDRLRAEGRVAQATAVIVLADRLDVSLQRRVDALGGRVLKKPASLLDIVDIIRAPRGVTGPGEAIDDPAEAEPQYYLPGARAEAPPPVAVAPEPRTIVRAEPPRTKRAWSRDGARTVARLWASRASGVLRVEGGNAAFVMIADGGPVGPDSMVPLEDVIGGARSTWDGCEVDDTGDRPSLGRLLWRAALEAAPGDTVLGLVPGRNDLSTEAGELPITAATRRCLGRLGGGLSVQALARREAAPVSDVAVDFAALHWLGLLTLGPAALAAHTPADPVASAPPPGAAKVEAVSDPPSVTRREAVAPRPSPREGRDGPSVQERVDDPATSATAALMPLPRLRREVEILKTADPWTVLGIARRTTVEVAKAASTRMRARYRRVEQDSNPEARELAAEILARIDAAEAEIVTGKPPTEPVFDGLLRSGVVALGTGDFARADRLLSQARQHRPDEPRTLAHLGWARFKNPEHPAESREDDGADLVELALQFDINCAQAWAYRGEMALVRGDPEEARQCFSTATKINPSLANSRWR